MPPPDLAVLAEGDLPTGQHWILKAGGTSADFYTGLETIHADGHRDEGGMGGPPLYPGSLMNTYTGGSERGLRRVVVRADPRVARVRVQLASGEQPELLLSPRMSPRHREHRPGLPASRIRCPISVATTGAQASR